MAGGGGALRLGVREPSEGGGRGEEEAEVYGDGGARGETEPRHGN
jgi:hypothetical protein